jgi:hypothetical protein
MAARSLCKAKRAAPSAKHTRPSLGGDVLFPFWNKNLKKFSCRLPWLLLMQFPSRNVDFSNPGADRAVPGGETLISSFRSRHQDNISVCLLHFQDCDLFSPQNKGFRSQMPL